MSSIDPTTPTITTAAPAPHGLWLSTLMARLTLGLCSYPTRSWIGRVMLRRADLPGLQRFTVTADHGHDPNPIKLDALHLPPTGERTGLPVVIVHGWLELKEFHLDRARRLADAGHDVILFDHRGHGRSTGTAVTFGVRERHDLAAVVADAARRGIITDRYITLGYSLGAATAIQHAPMDDRVDRIIAIAPFVDGRTAIDTFRILLAEWIDRGWLMAGFEQAARHAGFDLDQACTRSAIHGLEVPMLMITAGRDRMLPPGTHAEPLLAAKTVGPGVRVVHVPGADHVSLCRKRWPGMDEAIEDFCRR